MHVRRRARELAQRNRRHVFEADVDGDGDLDVVASSYMPLAPDASVRKRYRTEALIWLEQVKEGDRVTVMSPPGGQMGRCLG